MEESFRNQARVKGGSGWSREKPWPKRPPKQLECPLRPLLFKHKVMPLLLEMMAELRAQGKKAWDGNEGR